MYEILNIAVFRKDLPISASSYPESEDPATLSTISFKWLSR
jgi:hypothetical protein